MTGKRSRSESRHSGGKPSKTTQGLASTGSQPIPAEPAPDDWKLSVYRKRDETDQQALARYALMPKVAAAQTIKNTNRRSGASLDSIIEELGKQCDAASRNDLSRAEELLITQAHSLDALFHQLAHRAALNMGEYLSAAETYMRLALKAQSQCRTTLEALAEIKNPRPVAFVKQANIANGPQQVNNGTASPPEPSRAGESENPPSKLLEHTDGKRLDLGTAQAASEAHSQLEAVGAIDRTKESGR